MPALQSFKIVFISKKKSDSAFSLRQQKPIVTTFEVKISANTKPFWNGLDPSIRGVDRFDW
jgi:hypothetical protein